MDETLPPAVIMSPKTRRHPIWLKLSRGFNQSLIPDQLACSGRILIKSLGYKDK